MFTVEERKNFSFPDSAAKFYCEIFKFGYCLPRWTLSLSCVIDEKGQYLGARVLHARALARLKYPFFLPLSLERLPRRFIVVGYCG